MTIMGAVWLAVHGLAMPTPVWANWVALLCMTAPVRTPVTPPAPFAEDPFEGKAEVKAAFRSLFPYFAAATPPGLAERFTPDFLRAIPEPDLAKVFQELHEKYGQPRHLRLVRMTGPFAGEVELTFSKDMRVPVQVTVEAQPSHRIGGLVFKAALRDKDSWAEIEADLKKIPGTVACTVRPLGKKAHPLLEWNGEDALAVGSSFKLLVLATLAEELRAGRMAWQDVVKTDRRWYSLPGGILQDWPEGSPVTLHTLAALMISRSDNTAADHLLAHLGQKAVLDMQGRLASNPRFTRRHPQHNTPFLSTAELFKIKMKLNPEQQQTFADASEAERAKLLQTVVRPLSLAHPRMLTRPVHIDKIEWFYTTGDLCRIVDWLRQQEKVPHLKELLAIAPSFEVDETVWKYVGYKGGSEAGVLNYTLLLQHRSEKWYAVSITWNHAEQVSDEGRLREMVERILRLLAKVE